MRHCSKLMVVVALALAAIAVSAAPAFATHINAPGTTPTTVTPVGDYVGSDATAVLSGALTLTCSSTTTATITEDGTGTITALSFTNCTNGDATDRCTVTVNNLPYDITVTHNGTSGGTLYLDDTGNEISTNVTCTGTTAITCTFGPGTAATSGFGATATPGGATVTDDTAGSSIDFDAITLTSSSFLCGNSTWTATYSQVSNPTGAATAGTGSTTETQGATTGTISA